MPMYPRQQQCHQGQILEIFGNEFGGETQDVRPKEPVFDTSGRSVMERSTLPPAYFTQDQFQHGQIFEIIGEDPDEGFGEGLGEVFGELTQNVMPISDPAFDAEASSVMGNWQHQSHLGQVPDAFSTHIDYSIGSDSQQGCVWDLPDAEMRDIQGLPEQAPWGAAGLAYRPHAQSIFASGPPKYPNSQEWENIKPVFKQLYITENRPLKEVKEMLERDHGFTATERMFKGRLAPWGLTKNLKKAEKVARLRVVREARDCGQYLHHGRPIEHRLKRFLKETKSSSRTPRTTARRNRDRLAAATTTLNDHAETVNLVLHSLACSESQPSTPIILHGGLRATEEIVWNVKIYMGSYFTTGRGTWYFKVKPTVAACHGVPSQVRVLIKNDEAWRDIVAPNSLWNHVTEAFRALNMGFINRAFSNMERANNLVAVVLKQQNPYLLVDLFNALLKGISHSSNFARKICDFIPVMAANILGEMHPLTRLLNQTCQLSTTTERFHAWRAVNDVLDQSLECLEDSDLLWESHHTFFYELTNTGLLAEAEGYLDILYTNNGKIDEEDVCYCFMKAYLFKRQQKYMDAEALCRECLEFLKEKECTILAGVATSDMWEWRFGIDQTLYYLTEILEFTGRIEEAKNMWWRTIKFSHAAFGPESARSQGYASEFDYFLTENGFLEESQELRADYPYLLERQPLPKEFL